MPSDRVYAVLGGMRRKRPNAEAVEDIGSDLDFKRKGLRSLLERAVRGEKLKVVAAHCRRLARFGFELIEFAGARTVGRVVVLGEVSLSPEPDSGSDSGERLGQDLYAIIHVHSCRLDGRHSYARKKDH